MEKMTPQQKRLWLFFTHLPEEFQQTLTLAQLQQLAAKVLPKQGQCWDRQTLQKMLCELKINKQGGDQVTAPLSSTDSNSNQKITNQENHMNNDISMNEFRAEPVIPDTGIHAFRYDLRHGDVMKSAQLTAAACEGNWVEVNELLDQGADPRICRWTDGVLTCSPLYIALEQEMYYQADRLYDAGDRLDDLHLEGCKIPARILMCIITSKSWGRDLLVDESKPLSECARCFQVQRCRELVGSASQEELALAAEAIGDRFRHGWEERYWEIVSMLKEHRADFTKIKPEMARILAVLKKSPKVLQLDPEYTAKIEAFIAEI